MRKIDQAGALSYEQERCNWANANVGELPGEHCPICLNKGAVYFLAGGELRAKRCRCMEKRSALRRIEKSGLADTLKCCTLDSFKSDEPWQAEIKRAAERFLEIGGGWFFIGGAVGCGKTHICTAIVGELINRGIDARYMLWRDEAVVLKGMVNEPEYKSKMDALKRVQVLYIDDLFKTKKGGEPTEGDVNLAFELINNRYAQSGTITVISSEKTIGEITDIDEAIGSRVDQRCGAHKISILPGKGKNRRIW